MKKPNVKIISEQVEEITDKLLKNYLSNTVLVCLENKEYLGILKPHRNKFAICENDEIVRSFSPSEVLKISGKNKKTNLFESITKCGNHRYCVTSKTGKKIGGPYSTLKQAKTRLSEIEYFKHKKESNPILKESLKNKFFKLQEEIVNKDNKGKLTSSRQASRDKIERGLKDVKVIKGPPGRMDTPEEARYRLATFIELNKKSKK